MAIRSVREENLITEDVTADWKLTNSITSQDCDEDWRCPLIEGYASHTSVQVGESIKFYVNTRSDSFALQIFRMGYYGGAGARRMPHPNREQWMNLPRIQQPYPSPNGQLLECHWEANRTIEIPQEWISGVYLAKLTENSPQKKENYIIFVVREDLRPSDLLFQCSVTTYQAYNAWGKKSFYPHKRPGLDDISVEVDVVSFNRPYTANDEQSRNGNGAGQFLTIESGGARTERSLDARRVFEHSAPGSENPSPFDGWEYNMVRWLEKTGYDVTYCTNIDVHRNPALLFYHGTFLSVGHDEYWSAAARTNVENARDSGVNIAFFGGNTCFNCVQFDSDARTMTRVGAFRNRQQSLPDGWPANGWPEAPFIGGTWAEGDNTDEDMFVNDNLPAWLLRGTSLQAGDKFGVKIRGYETNGLAIWDHFDQDDVNKVYTSSQFLPDNMSILFVGLYPAPGQTFTVRSESIIYTSARSGARVFSAATLQWIWALDELSVVPEEQRYCRSGVGRASRYGDTAGSDGEKVRIVTGNVLDDLGATPSVTSLAHRWTFETYQDGSVVDSVESYVPNAARLADVTHSAPGSVPPGVTRDLPGPYSNSKAIRIRESDGSVNFGTSVDRFRRNDFSITLWLKTAEQLRLFDIVGNRAGSSNGVFFGIRMTGRHESLPAGIVIAEIDENGNHYIAVRSAANTLNDDRWHHIAAVRQGTSLRLYIDGALSGTAAAAGVANVLNNFGFKLGRSLVGVEEKFAPDALYSDLRIYRGALTDAEVLSIFQYRPSQS